MQKHKGRSGKTPTGYNSGTSLFKYARNAKPSNFQCTLAKLKSIIHLGQYSPSTKKTTPKKSRYQGTKETNALVKFGSVKGSLASQFLTDSDACCMSGVRQEIDQHRFFSRHSFKLHGTSDCRFTFGKNFARDLKSVFGPPIEI